VVEAEGLPGSGTCGAVGPSGGPVSRACTPGAVTDVGVEPYPDGVYATLRARHAGDEVTMEWTAARALTGGEHFHLLKTRLDPTAPFVRANPEADVARSHVETDASAWLQFFDLRVANACEDESLDEFPPDLGRR
jgi:hypothetical protein